MAVLVVISSLYSLGKAIHEIMKGRRGDIGWLVGSGICVLVLIELALFQVVHYE